MARIETIIGVGVGMVAVVGALSKLSRSYLNYKKQKARTVEQREKFNDLFDTAQETFNRSQKEHAQTMHDIKEEGIKNAQEHEVEMDALYKLMEAASKDGQALNDAFDKYTKGELSADEYSKALSDMCDEMHKSIVR